MTGRHTMTILRTERTRLRLTQAQMCALLWGMPARTYQDIEAGRRKPPGWVMKAILEKIKSA